MTSRKRKGDAGEAAWTAKREADGWRCFPLSPAFEGCDILSIGPDGEIELAEVKAWTRSLTPSIRIAVVDRMNYLRSILPRWAQRRLTTVLVHAVKGEDGEYRCTETWRFP